MNVIVILDKNDDQINNVLMGWGYAFSAMGYGLIVYHGESPLFRIFENYKPAYMLMSAAGISKVHQKVVKEFSPQTLVFFRKNSEFRLHIEGSKEISVITEGDSDVGQYYAPFSWDSVNYGRHKKNPKYLCKYAYIGRYNPKLDKLFNDLGKELRIYSPDVHNSLSYVGHDDNKPAIFASADTVVLGETDDGGGLIDTDMWNALYSGAKVGIGATPELNGKHSYFHTMFELVSKACTSDHILSTKLFEKMKEVENENRISTE
jgi:hypothetical protein